MNVLVYSGPEVLQASLNNALSTLRSILLPHYTVQTITQHALTSQPWTTSCALLVLPGCRELFQSTASTTISEFVENGGAFLGLATGALYSIRAQDHPRLPSTGTSKDSNSLPLRFFDKFTGSYIYPSSSSGSESAPRSADLQSVDGTLVRGIFQSSVCDFSGFDDLKSVKALARYTKDGVDGEIAGLRCDVGAGRVVLWAPNLEYPLSDEQVSAVSSLPSGEVFLSEQRRSDLMKSTLVNLGLQLPSSEGKIHNRPLAQFLTSQATKPKIVSQIADSIAAPSTGSQLSVFEANEDTFHFHSLAESAELMKKLRADTYGSDDPAKWQPKHVIICPDGQIPEADQTPLFDLGLYYRALQAARTKEKFPDSADTWGIGEALLYGEAVTSTHTMLDKNPHLLAALPSPIVSLASHQLAGRGRGANVWLSPAGCLQFSVFLRVSLAALPANKLVFVQYLFALAVAEACRDESVLGKRGSKVRLKWPNDLYADLGDGERKKIGGTLVSTGFSNGNVDIVIGCGLNILNPPPITSLSQLVSPGEGQSLSLERAAAAIFARFETMWAVFLKERGSFSSFNSLYLERWLHSDQLVTLTTTVPHKLVRIVGITPEHGLLRTTPERTGWSTGEDEGFIDLQPDGNSFDIMAGLIKSKT